MNYSLKEALGKTPFFRLTLALIVGISLFLGFGFSLYILYVLLGISAVGITFFFLGRIGTRWAFHHSLFGVGVLCMIVGVGYVLSYMSDKQTVRLSGESVDGVFEVEVIKYPIEKNNSVLVDAKIIRQSCRDMSIDLSGQKIKLYFQKDTSVLQIQCGDKILLSTTLLLPQPKGNPYEFDYGNFLIRNGICATGYVANDSWHPTGVATGFSPMRWSKQIRQRLLNIYRQLNIYGDEFAIISALTLGYTDAITPEIRDSFSATGTAHIIAVSGLHTGVIYLILSLLLSFIDKNNKTKSIKPLLIIVCLWFYAFLTGFSPSVCRAALMFSLFEIAKLMGRERSIYNTIFLSAFIILLVNPMWLLHVGFQLSYLTVLSIVYFYPKISKFILFKNRMLRCLWEMIAVSVSAQLAAAPICLYYFHQFPNYFVIANIGAVFIATLMIYTALLLFVISSVPLVSSFVANILVYETKGLYGWLSIIADFPFSTTTYALPMLEVVVLYGMILCIALLFYKQRYRYFVFCLLLAILCGFISVFYKFKTLSFSELVVFDDSRNIIINITDSEQNIVFTTDSVAAQIACRTNWIYRYSPQPQYIMMGKDCQVMPFCFDDKKYLILSSDSISSFDSETVLNVDYLIVSKGAMCVKEVLEGNIKTQNIIILSGVGAYQKRKLKNDAKKYNITCYDIKDKGAFVVKY